MIINKMKLKIVLLVAASLINAQEAIYWEVVDPTVNSEFIESYIDHLIKVDKIEQNSIQASHSIIVHLDVSSDQVELKKLKAKNYQMGEYQSFDMKEIEKMDPVQLNTIISRKYKWKDVSRRDLSELDEFSTVDNIFQERSFKDARDAFWWSNSQVSVSSAMKVFIRQKSSSLAFRIEQGFGDLGLSRQLSENLILGLSNDIVSTYMIVPGNTESVVSGIGHPVEGNLGFGFKFDTHTLGGQVNYMDVDGQEYDHKKVFSRKHMIIPASSGLFYWSNTFQINRKVDSSYGTKIKDQKKEKERSEKEIAKSRVWRTEDEEFSGLFQSLDEDGYVIIVVDRDDKAHKMAEKGREWTTSSGSSVKAILKERKRDKVTLLRKSDDFTMVFKKKELSEEDQKFLERLKWDNEKTKKIFIDKFLSQDQRLVRSATGTVKARRGKGKELKVSQPFASMRLKAGLSFVQFVHARWNDEASRHEVTDRVTGSNSIGLYAKVEGVTDSKRSKSYLQFNVSPSGFKAYSFGLEHNIWRMVNVGFDLTLYPNNSFIEFSDRRNDNESKWKWYPGSRPDEAGSGGGSMIISPYFTVNF